MSLNSKIVPAVFWVGFLALGFVTSLGGPGKQRAEHVARPAKTAIAAPAMVAQTDKPALVKVDIRTRAQD